MQEYGIQAKKRRRYKPTTNSKHTLPVAPNLLDRNFSQEKPNQAWVADITYIHTEEGFLYLATVMDLCTRKIVGWSLKNRMFSSLVCDAANMAFGRESPGKGLIFHSDRGSQYASLPFRQLLWKHQITQSMSRKGNCWDNAPMESFFDTLKSEHVYHEKFITRQKAKNSIFEWIEVFYNRERIHSSLGYQSPACFEKQFTVRVA